MKKIYLGSDDLLRFKELERVFNEECKNHNVNLQEYMKWFTREDLPEEARRMACYLTYHYRANFDHFYRFILGRLNKAYDEFENEMKVKNKVNVIEEYKSI